MSVPSKPYWLAIIREDECVGCTKCLQACPVDAIIGATNLMHTVIEQECIGCKKCIEPCPVDCIDLVAVSERPYQPVQVQRRAKMRKERLEQEQRDKVALYQKGKAQIIKCRMD